MKRRNFIKGMGLVGAAAYVDPLSLISPNSLLYPNQLWKPSVKALYTPTFSNFQLDKGKLEALVKQGVMDIQGNNLLFAWPFHSDWLVSKPDWFARCGGITNQDWMHLEWTQLENLGLKEIGSLSNNLLHNINPYRMLEWAAKRSDTLEDWENPYQNYDDMYALDINNGLDNPTLTDNDGNSYQASNQPVYSIPIKNFGQLVDYCSYQWHTTYEYYLAFSQIGYDIENDEVSIHYGNIKAEKAGNGWMVSLQKHPWDDKAPVEWENPVKYKGCHYAHGCPEKKTGCYAEKGWKRGSVDKHGICHSAHGGDEELDCLEESIGYMKMIANPLSRDNKWNFGDLPNPFWGDLSQW